MELVGDTVKQVVTERLVNLEEHFTGDVAFFHGPIDRGMIRTFRDFIEATARNSICAGARLVFFLNTPGGSVEAAEKMVEVMRHHYQEVYFLVPDAALSAGTILCMSGDRIYMDYCSSLGPIDPQVWNGKAWVPALGYLDKVEQLLDKASKGTLSNAEYLILQNQDLAELRAYEQARDLTITLLKKWLVEYKFRNWGQHETNPSRRGQPVTDAEKVERAEEIARLLGDNKFWHSHGRLIGPNTLQTQLRLRIDDYSQDDVLRPLVRAYNDLLTQYVTNTGFGHFLHSRKYF